MTASDADPRSIGIDEAGRGPVLGPMVLAAVCVPASRLAELEALGVDDSKKLSAKKREALVDPIMALASEVRIVELGPPVIDAAVNGGGGLDRLEARTAARLIAELSADVLVGTAYVDAVGAGGHTHRRRIAEALGPDRPELVVENKADERYAVVAAASILAKVTRDKRIRAMGETHGELGSGYPSDPKTRVAIAKLARAHVEEGAPIPEYVRRSWATVQNAIDAVRQGEVSG